MNETQNETQKNNSQNQQEDKQILEKKVVSTGGFEKPYNLDPNIEAAIAYLPFIGLFTSLAIFFVEKKNPFVRFHAMQGILLGVAHFILVSALAVTIILAVFITLVNLVAFMAWCFMMWKAYNKEEYELPFIGKIARDQLKS
ncbi:hypothetical protein HYV31_03315 [candidate division WWE3 bacterium]|nr:hypothetical protein [candidate division WWE3 bacterium]